MNADGPACSETSGTQDVAGPEAVLRQLAGPLLAGLAESIMAPDGEPVGPDVMYRLTEARYRTLLEQIPAVTFMASLEHGLREVYVSPQIESLLGYSQREWLENPVLWYERLHPDDKDRWNLEFARTVAFGEDFHSVYRFLARDGRVVWILGDTKIVRGASGHPIFVQGVGFDITELKRAEEELRQRTIELDIANRELETFSYSISHDLRSPLQGVEGFSHILLEEYGDRLDEQGRRYLRRVNNAAQRMARMIDGFLSLYRITRKDLELAWVDLSAIARMVAQEVKESEPDRLVEIRIAPTRKAYADAALFKIALANLLGNAWKFTRKHARGLIEFGETTVNGEHVYFVRDDGAGFDMAYVAKLFQPFERLHHADEFPGTGIGLATVQRVIQRHGGRIWAEGAVERGASFYFTTHDAGAGR
ncbi:MAG TPA: PAS domain-containing protein [Gemmatimonadales bacterium]|nr:PAS domain-containing protein [Gemmatimonadales bacterium]